MLKFLAFADFHYEKMTFRTSLDDLEKIIERANYNSVDFIIHAGDFCGDYKNSPELSNAYLRNPHNLPCYGVVGNHDLENGNSLETVKKNLNNRDVVVPFEDAGCWYTDIKGYRIVALDSNYSYNPETARWEHDIDFNCKKGNTFSRSLSPFQIEWIDSIISDAHINGVKVILVAHDGFSDASKGKSPDSEKISNIFKKYAGTVILSINGHYHTDGFEKIDGVCYLSLNSATIGYSRYCTENHYKPEHTFTYTEYDKNGKMLSNKNIPLSKLKYGSSIFHYSSPLSAVITITDDNRIIVEGGTSEWLYGVAPELTDLQKEKIYTYIKNRESYI